MRFLSLLLLIACGGADPDTLIPDLRVMAIRQQPAEASPFAPITVEVWVANPEQRSVDMMVWPCTSFGDDCLEAEYFSEQNEPWAQAFSIDGSETALYATTTLSIPPLLGGLLQEIPEEEQPFRGGQLAVLACYSGLCPIINRVKAGIQPTEDLKKSSRFNEQSTDFWRIVGQTFTDFCPTETRHWPFNTPSSCPASTYPLRPHSRPRLRFRLRSHSTAMPMKIR